MSERPGAEIRSHSNDEVRDQIAALERLLLSWDDRHGHATLALQELRALDPEISPRRTDVPFWRLSALNAGISPA